MILDEGLQVNRSKRVGAAVVLMLGVVLRTHSRVSGQVR